MQRVLPGFLCTLLHSPPTHCVSLASGTSPDRKAYLTITPKLRHVDCMQRRWLPMSLMERKVKRSGVMTAMREKFTMTELNALRNDLLQGGMVDSREAAELLQVFLLGRGYGVSPQAALDAAGRVEISGCSLPVLERELEGLALVM